MTWISKSASQIALAASVALIGCTEPKVQAARQLSTHVIVSSTVDQSGLLSRVALTRSAGPAVTTANALSEASVVYVSMPPGSIPGGQNANIHNRVSSQVLSVAMVDGGFDPQAVAAAVGDTLEIDVDTPTGTVTELDRVPPRRAPTIVRTAPPKGKTAVPLNTQIVVVFSEPIDPATIAGALRLFAGATDAAPAVAGVAKLDGSGFVATFTPDSLLAPDANYTTVITTGVRNLVGDPLNEGAQVGFTTGSLFSNPPFESAGSMAFGRADATATVLPDGRVLILGGTQSSVYPDGEVYDPAARSFSSANSMMTLRAGHPAVTLPGGKLFFLDGIVLQDGRVFFASLFSTTVNNSAEIYDPVSGTSTQVGYDAQTDLNFYWNTATLLLDGRVLLTGSAGKGLGTPTLSESKLFDPRTNSFKDTALMEAGFYDSTGWGTLLEDGTVLFVAWCWEACNDPVSLYDPSTETFTDVGYLGGDFPLSRAVRLADGRVLITGGQLPGGNGTRATWIYAPQYRTLYTGFPMLSGRHEHTSTLLPDGSVLVAGGYSYWPSLTQSAELFHPSPSTP